MEISGIEVLPFMCLTVYPPEQRKIRGIVQTMERQAFLPSGSLLQRGKTTCAIISLPSGWCLKLLGDPVSAVERLILLNAWEL